MFRILYKHNRICKRKAATAHQSADVVEQGDIVDVPVSLDSDPTAKNVVGVRGLGKLFSKNLLTSTMFSMPPTPWQATSANFGRC